MKKLKYAAFAVLGLYACFNFTSCKKDTKDEPSQTLTGVWICTQVNDPQAPLGIGSGLVFFNESFTSDDKLISGNKCFIIWNNAENNYSSYTLQEWNSQVEGHGKDQEFPEVYILKGNDLTIMECDLDRTVGTITIDGNTMIYTYKYQDWNYNSGTMTSEDPTTYISTYQKK